MLETYKTMGILYGKIGGLHLVDEISVSSDIHT
jgi:hypothetical protein